MEIVELRGLAGKMLERPVVAFDEGRGAHLDKVAENEAVGDEAFHGLLIRTGRRSVGVATRSFGKLTDTTFSRARTNELGMSPFARAR